MSLLTGKPWTSDTRAKVRRTEKITWRETAETWSVSLISSSSSKYSQAYILYLHDAPASRCGHATASVHQRQLCGALFRRNYITHSITQFVGLKTWCAFWPCVLVVTGAFENFVYGAVTFWLKNTNHCYHTCDRHSYNTALSEKQRSKAKQKLRRRPKPLCPSNNKNAHEAMKNAMYIRVCSLQWQSSVSHVRQTSVTDSG